MENQILTQLLSRSNSKIPEIKPRKSILQNLGFELIDKKTGFPLVKYHKVKVQHNPITMNSRKNNYFSSQIRINFQGIYEERNTTTQRRTRKKTKKLSIKMAKKIYLKSRYRSLDAGCDKVSSEDAYYEKANQLKKLFDCYDLDKDGMVSLNEMKKALRNKMELHGVEELFKEYDKNADGQLSLDEFMSMFLPQSILSKRSHNYLG